MNGGAGIGAVLRLAARVVLGGIALIAAPATGLGHESRPAFLQITESADASGRFDLLWKTPARGPDLRLGLDVVLPADCRLKGVPEVEFTGDAFVERSTFEREGGLDGMEVYIEGLAGTLTDALVRVERTGGASQVVRLTPQSPSFSVAAVPGFWGTLTTYLVLGVEHILLGVDHLLFVLGLLLIVDGRRMLVKTITAFTVAHSITLAVATFRIASIPAGPLNAAIALSILFLGPEIVRSWRGGTSLTIRLPWIVAFGFGLLHGFGFASGLSTAGMPPGAIPWALLWFNVGVEIGQLCFVAVALAMAWAFRVLEMRWPRWVERAPGYLVGICGAFWTIDRTAALFAR